MSSADYVRRTLNRHGVTFVGVVDATIGERFTGPPDALDFCVTNSEMMRYQADRLDTTAAELERIAPDAVLYGYEYELAMADVLAMRLAPRFANDPATASLREDKGATDECLRAANLPVPAAVRFSLGSGLNRTDLDQLNPVVDHVVIKSARCTSKPVLATKDSVETTLARMLHERGPSNEPLLCQDAHFDYDCDGLQQTFSLDGFAVGGRYHFVSLQRWHKIVTATGIDYCWTEQLDVRAAVYMPLLDHARMVLGLLGMRNGFFHPEFTNSDQGLILLDLNPRVAGASGVVDRMIAARQGAGVVDEFVEAMYRGSARHVPDNPPAVRLLALYGMSPEDLHRISALESVAEVVFVGLGSTHVVRFNHLDAQCMLADVRHCLESFTQTRYGVRVTQGSRMD